MERAELIDQIKDMVNIRAEESGIPPLSVRAGNGGYSLIELIVAVVILGFIVTSFASVGTNILSLSVNNDNLAAAVRIARNRMEESVRIGPGAATTGWNDQSSYQWRREVSVLKSGDEGATLSEIRINVRDDGGLLCTLVTHVAD
jgi:prepilin-type N-terminal cleavage/methylation domain-containing protein